MATVVKKPQQSNKFDSVFECPRCSGKGYLEAFRHIKNGVCFLCAGNKTIALNKAYPKKEQIICTVLKGYTNQYTDRTYTKLEYVYREAISLSFDGGHSTEFARIIDDSNRAEMRAIWLWAKTNGAQMIVKEEDSPRY